jgi:putative transposase
MLDMGIIKIEVNLAELRETWTSLKKQREKFFEHLGHELKSAASVAIHQIMNSEMAVFLGKPEQNGNKRNGYEVKKYGLKGVGAIELRIPIDRRREFESEIVPKGERMDPRLKEDMAVLHLAGLSTRTLAMISKRILGVEVGRDQVSKSLEIIEEKALSWLERPITDKYWALYVDGTNFNLQRKGATEREPSLVVLGIDEQNRKSIIAISPGSKEDSETWRELFEDLIRRGLDPLSVQIGIMDGLPGLEDTFRSVFTRAVTARCWAHAKRNAVAKCPARLREGFETFLKKVMYASSESEAKKAFFQLKNAIDGEAERAVRCIEKDLDSLLAHYRFEKKFWIALKTTNPIERVNKEFKRRSRGMESMGERTLECLQAFTALRLEMNWKKTPIDSFVLENLNPIKNIEKRQNQIEEAVNTLLQ